jgi:hypothetical protein
VKYFISCEVAVQTINSPYFREILHPSIQPTCDQTLRTSIFPRVFDLLTQELEKRLNESAYVVIIPDGWTSLLNKEYLGNFHNFSCSNILEFWLI